MGAFSTGVVLYGMVLLYGFAGGTGLEAIARAAAMAGLRNPALLMAMVLLAAGFGFKIAAVPFHMYLPDMYEGAPTPVVAYMAGATELAGVAVLLRVFLLGCPALQVDWSLLFWVLAVLTMTIGNLVAIAQANLKRMLAYSTIAHMGYILIGPVVGSQLGVAAVLFYSLAYALMTIGAFGMVMLLAHGTVRGDQIDDFTGLAQKHPLAAAIMLLFLLSLTGIPPTAGFVGKFYLFAAAVEAGYYWLVLIAVVNSAISLFYYMRVVVAMYMRDLPPQGMATSPPSRSTSPCCSPRPERCSSASSRAPSWSLPGPPRPGSAASRLSSAPAHIPAPGRFRRLTRGRSAWHTFATLSRTAHGSSQRQGMDAMADLYVTWPDYHNAIERLAVAVHGRAGRSTRSSASPAAACASATRCRASSSCRWPSSPPSRMGARPARSGARSRWPST